MTMQTVDSFSVWKKRALMEWPPGMVAEAIAIVCGRCDLVDELEASRLDWSGVELSSLDRVGIVKFDAEEGYLTTSDLSDFIDWKRVRVSADELEGVTCLGELGLDVVWDCVDWEKAADALAGNCVDLKRFDCSVEDWHRPARASR